MSTCAFLSGDNRMSEQSTYFRDAAFFHPDMHTSAWQHCFSQRVIQYSHVSIRTHRSIVCFNQCSNDHSVLSRQHMYSTVKCIVHSSCHDYVCSLVTKFAHFWSPRSTLCISSKPGLRVLLGDQICAFFVTKEHIVHFSQALSSCSPW